MRRLIYTAIVLAISCLVVMAQEDSQGIKFYEGTFEEALNEAVSQDKPLFVDFYATWCVPCKKMAKTVFVDPKVGEYFNKHFINYKMDAEAEENKPWAEKYKVQAFPTLGFLKPDGTPINIQIGAVTVAELLKNAKVATGEQKSFEELYNDYRKNKKDLAIQQRLLQQAPQFLTAQEGLDADKWAVRIKKIFREYFKSKKGADFINAEDYIIVSTLSELEPDVIPEMVDFINANLDAWLSKVGEPTVYFIVEYNDQQMEAKAKAGDPSYKDCLEKINGEYAKAYSIIPQGKVSIYDQSKLYYDALFTLYKEKDGAKYIEMMKHRFDVLGAEAQSNEYGQAAQSLYYVLGNKLSTPQHEQAIEWVKKALEKETVPMERINLLVMLGDSHKAIKKYDEARKLYNQSYAESLQLTDMEMVQMMLQSTIKRKLSELDLLQ